MTTSQVGAPRPRADTPAKVRGATRYAADHSIRGLPHARLVLAPIGRRRPRVWRALNDGTAGDGSGAGESRG